MLCANARSACFAPAKAAKYAAPRIPAVAPVKMIVPRSRCTIRFAVSRPVRKAPKHAISQILKYFRAVSSKILHGTFAPILKIMTSIGPISASICSIN